jgi:hypothetical protein
MKLSKINEAVRGPGETVYHGGTYKGGKYNIMSKGEPGDLRPLGYGIYAGHSYDHAARYLKYVEGSTVQIFKVPEDATIIPWGGWAWKHLTAEERNWWNEKYDEIQKAFEENGLTKESFGKMLPWEHTVSDRTFDRDAARKLLVSLGIDGAAQDLGEGYIEYVFYNPEILELVS